MTGPDHYQRSQELAQNARNALEVLCPPGAGSDGSPEAMAAIAVVTAVLAEAQVHATLAMVALQRSVIPLSEKTDAAWREAGAW